MHICFRQTVKFTPSLERPGGLANAWQVFKEYRVTCFTLALYVSSLYGPKFNLGLGDLQQIPHQPEVQIQHV